MRARRALAVVLAAAVVIVAAVVLLVGGSDDDSSKLAAEPATQQSDVAGVRETKALLDGIPQDEFMLGDPNAPVTLLEFIDLQCPFCKQHQLEVQPEVIDALVRTKQAKIAFVPLAFLGEDSAAARNVFLRMAEQGHGWDFANLFFWNQGHENTGYVTEAYLARLIAEIPGTSPADASREQTPAHAEIAQQFDALGDHVLRPREGGTPSFTVGPSDGPPGDYTWIELSSDEPPAAQLIRAVRAERAKVLRDGAATVPGGTA